MTPNEPAPVEPLRPAVVDLTAVRVAAGGVEDPEIRRPLAELDLLDDVVVDGDGRVTVHYHLTSPLCPSPFAIQIGREVRRRVEAVAGVTRCEVAIADHYVSGEISRAVNGAPVATPEVAAHALAGRREAALLDLPSVARCADLLARRTGSEAVVRSAVATVDRFRTLVAGDLEALLADAHVDVEVADEALARLASALSRYSDTQVATLAFGPKVWFRANEVPVAWRPLPSSHVAATREAMRGTRVGDVEDPAVRALVLAMVGSGLAADELVALRVGDIGSMGPAGELVPDPRSEPLAVRRENGLAFLGFEAREALLDRLLRRQLAGERLDERSPLFVEADGSPAGQPLVSRARRAHVALIGVSNTVNVSLCRATGDFFREWGMPGSHWQPSATRPAREGAP